MECERCNRRLHPSNTSGYCATCYRDVHQEEETHIERDGERAFKVEPKQVECSLCEAKTNSRFKVCSNCVGLYIDILEVRRQKGQTWSEEERQFWIQHIG